KAPCCGKLAGLKPGNGERVGLLGCTAISRQILGSVLTGRPAYCITTSGISSAGLNGPKSSYHNSLMHARIVWRRFLPAWHVVMTRSQTGLLRSRARLFMVSFTLRMSFCAAKDRPDGFVQSTGR